MIVWQCDQLSELSEAIFYESKLFQKDIRILAFTAIDEGYSKEELRKYTDILCDVFETYEVPKKDNNNRGVEG